MGPRPNGSFDQALKNVMPVLEVRARHVSVVRTTKCQLKFVLIAVKHSVFAGL